MPLDAPYAVPPTLRTLRGAIPVQTIGWLRGLNSWALGDRPPPPPGQSQRNWDKTVRDMVADGTIGNPGRLFSFLKGTEIEKVWREVLGPQIALCVTSTIMRDFNPENRPIPARWHFDAFLLGMSTPILNTWIPLNDVGRDAPGMTMSKIPHWPNSYWQKLADIADENGLVPNERQEEVKFEHQDIMALAAQEGESPLFDTILDAGDVIIFDHQHIHATQYSLRQAGRRMSLEIRVLPVPAALRLKELGNPHMFIPFD